MESNANILQDSFIKSKDPQEIKYKKYADYEFDYEINTYDLEKEEENSMFKIEKFPDELAPKFYKCEKINVLNRKWIKTIVSRNKIRLVNSKFDLDLMYIIKNKYIVI